MRPKFADAVLREFPAVESLADVGCGSGGFAAEFQGRGLRVMGCEYSEAARRCAGRKGLEVLPFDLSDNPSPLPGQPYDLVATLEVAEHVPPELADALVGYLCAMGNLIIFTAAQPGQGGHGHVNEQPKTYWMEKFARAGFHVDQQATERIEQLREAGGVLVPSHQSAGSAPRCVAARTDLSCPRLPRLSSCFVKISSVRFRLA